MAEDQVRVMRVLEYVGDRSWVEDQVNRSIQGERFFIGVKGSGVIRAATIGSYPEILETASPPSPDDRDDTRGVGTIPSTRS